MVVGCLGRSRHPECPSLRRTRTAPRSYYLLQENIANELPNGDFLATRAAGLENLRGGGLDGFGLGSRTGTYIQRWDALACGATTVISDNATPGVLWEYCLPPSR